VARIAALLEPLKTPDAASSDAPAVRAIDRRRGFNVASVFPSIEWIVGQESASREDTQGYECVFPVLFKINVEGRDPYDAADALVGAVQFAIEQDALLSGLANEVVYVSETPFTNVATGEEGGTLLSYQVHYRRLKGQPDKGY